MPLSEFRHRWLKCLSIRRSRLTIRSGSSNGRGCRLNRTSPSLRRSLVRLRTHVRAPGCLRLWWKVGVGKSSMASGRLDQGKQTRVPFIRPHSVRSEANVVQTR